MNIKISVDTMSATSGNRIGSGSRVRIYEAVLAVVNMLYLVNTAIF